MDPAKGTGLDDLSYSMIILCGMYLRTQLKDCFIFFQAFFHCLTFFDSILQGFFTVNIFACLEGHYGNQGMPVVRGGSGKYINVLSVEDMPEICIGINLPVWMLFLKDF